MTRRALEIGLAAAISSIAACSTPRDVPATSPTYTYDAAVQGVHNSIEDAAKSLSLLRALEEGTGGTQPCAGPDDDETTDQVMYEQVYWIRKVPIDKMNTIFQQIKSYWQRNGYVIDLEDINTSSRGVWTLVASSRPTGFKMKLVKASNGELSLGAQSPCVFEPGQSRTPSAISNSS